MGICKIYNGDMVGLYNKSVLFCAIVDFYCVICYHCIIMARKPREDGRNARTVANTKASEKKYDTLKVYVEKGQRDAIKKHADSLGCSINSLINRLLSEEISGFTPIGKENEEKESTV